MEPELTERDVALLMLNEESWVALGAVLGLEIRLATERGLREESSRERSLPA